MARSDDAFVTEKALQISNIHAARQKPGSHGVPQQMRINAFGNAGGARHLAHELAYALACEDIRN